VGAVARRVPLGLGDQRVLARLGPVEIEVEASRSLPVEAQRDRAGDLALAKRVVPRIVLEGDPALVADVFPAANWLPMTPTRTSSPVTPASWTAPNPARVSVPVGAGSGSTDAADPSLRSSCPAGRSRATPSVLKPVLEPTGMAKETLLITTTTANRTATDSAFIGEEPPSSTSAEGASRGERNRHHHPTKRRNRKNYLPSSRSLSYCYPGTSPGW